MFGIYLLSQSNTLTLPVRNISTWGIVYWLSTVKDEDLVLTASPPQIWSPSSHSPNLVRTAFSPHIKTMKMLFKITRLLFYHCTFCLLWSPLTVLPFVLLSFVCIYLYFNPKLYLSCMNLFSICSNTLGGVSVPFCWINLSGSLLVGTVIDSLLSIATAGLWSWTHPLPPSSFGISYFIVPIFSHFFLHLMEHIF